MNDRQDIERMLSDYVERACKLADQDRFDEALASLREAYKLPSLTEDEASVIQAREEEIEETRRGRVQALTEELEKLLSQAPETLAPDDLNRGAETLARLQNIHPTPTDLEPLAEGWQTHRRKAEMLREYEATREKLEALWQSPYVMLSSYDQALALARQKDQDYDEPLFNELLAKAQARRKEAYQKEGELTTQVIQQDFGVLIKELEQLDAKGYKELPGYKLETREVEGKPIRAPMPGSPAPSQEAIERARQLAKEYEDQKADEYIQRAEKELPAHPESAARWIKDAQAFKHISPTKKEALQAFHDETIAEALRERQQANDLVRDARQAGRRDIEKAWNYLNQAEAIDPHAPEIANARKELRPYLIVHLEGILRRAAEKRQAGDFETVEDMAEAVDEIAAADEGLRDVAGHAQALLRECDADKALLEATQKEATSIKGQVNTDLAAAAQSLADLEAKVAGRPDRFQALLQGARNAVQSRQSLEKLLADWERRFQRADPGQLDTAESMHQALAELERLEAEANQARAERGRRKELSDFEKRLQARRRFIQGRLDWEQGLYRRAKNAWTEVVEAEGDDATPAKEWLGKADDATAATRAIKQAQAHQEDGEYKEALDVLRDWRTKASPRQQDVQELYRQIEGEWADYLEGEIKELIADLEQRPAYRELVERIGQLEILAPDRAREYKYAHLVPIYEEWGDYESQAGQYTEATIYYQQALGLASGQDRARIERKHYQARREQVFLQAEQLISQGQDQEAQERLSAWLGESSNDVPSLAWLADLFLVDEESERAQLYLQQAERRLEAAEQEGNPARAGLEKAEEITEWRLRIEALRRKAVAVADIRQEKQRISIRLRLNASLQEYLLARGARDGLIQGLKQARDDMRQQEKEHPLLASLPGEAQDRVRRSWREVRRWFDEQVRPNAGIQAWYDEQERNLLGHLREIWEQAQKPDLESLDFRAVSPADEIRQRWEVGLKLRFLFRGDDAGKTALREVTRAQTRLGRAVEQFIGDERGPEHDLQNQKLQPPDALEAQLDWSEHLLDWATLLTGLLESYTWATEGRVEKEEGEPKPYQHAREIQSKIEEFRKALLGLKSAIQQAEGQLNLAKTAGAGRDGRRRWGHVPWSRMVIRILRSSKAPLPVEDGRELGQDYWKNLEHNDVDVRWSAWQKAVEVLQQMRLADQPQAAPWEEINPVILQAGLEEVWAEVGEPLKDHLVRFGRHQTVRWLLEKRDEAETTRNQLVVATLMLYTLVQAEEFRAALEQMAQMEEALDPKDEYGFRSDALVREPEALPWEELKASLQARQRQWEIFQIWWAQVEQSSLHPWQETGCAQAVRLMKQASFDEAEALCQDALSGAQGEGHTNRLGGGLALEPLLGHLENRPPELQQPLGHRLHRALKKANDWHHDVRQAVDELRFWLRGQEGQHRPEEIPEPLASRRDTFKAAQEALDDALEVLQGSWRFWRKKAKEDQRQYCWVLLEEVRRVAPDWPKLEEYERRIREA